ncbi:hypothetical protein ARMGADRAFT_1040187 [Armillaria gallica]|uniref:Uncharacterized protein n=1 Tax=Armillaria gallica TaxID=47427 RepID=A0A2H3CEM5_ARMGA|nr:hypothetical protein ARMGADRAFT_1040187 [Armillaria gallica]
MRPDACQGLQIGSMYQRLLVILIISSIARASVADVSPDDDDGVPVCIEDRRTLLNIVWSCLATIFACTWLAVHPNVPGRNITSKGEISCAIERAEIMAVAILAPEVIVAWAAEQLTVAWKLMTKLEEISAETIVDKSKGNGLSKPIFVLQIS